MTDHNPLGILPLPVKKGWQGCIDSSSGRGGLVEHYKVGPHYVPVTADHPQGLGDECYGEFFALPAPLIYVNAQMLGTARHSALLHELIEAIDWTYGVGLTERQIRLLEAALLMLGADNPALVQLLWNSNAGGSP